MTVCPKCNGKGTVGYFHIDHFVDIECERCNGSGEVSEVEMTNEEYIRSCSTEELADVIAERIINSHTMFEYILHQDNRRKEDLVREIREWLKEKKE